MMYNNKKFKMAIVVQYLNHTFLQNINTYENIMTIGIAKVYISLLSDSIKTKMIKTKLQDTERRIKRFGAHTIKIINQPHYLQMNKIVMLSHWRRFTRIQLNKQQNLIQKLHYGKPNK